MIIGILGEKVAGKDTVAEHLIDRYGAEHIKTSQILDELLEVLDLPITRRNEIDAGRGMESIFGPRVIGEAVLKRVNKSKSDLIVVNGLRIPDQFEDVKKMGAKIIYITAPVELRYQRSILRKKNKDPEQTLEQFKAQDTEWTEINIPKLGAKADFKIENTGTLEELYKKIDEIINKL